MGHPSDSPGHLTAGRAWPVWKTRSTLGMKTSIDQRMHSALRTPWASRFQSKSSPWMFKVGIGYRSVEVLLLGLSQPWIKINGGLA